MKHKDIIHLIPYDVLQRIKLVMNSFDFNTVKDTMDCLDWRWFPKGEVPSISEIKHTAEYLLKTSYVEFDDSISKPYVPLTMSTGGLDATCTKDDNGRISFELKFVVTEWMEMEKNYGIK